MFFSLLQSVLCVLCGSKCLLLNGPFCHGAHLLICLKFICYITLLVENFRTYSYMKKHERVIMPFLSLRLILIYY